MLKEELVNLVEKILIEKIEGQNIEIKSANKGFPKIWDTLSAFANQSSGGIIIFGIDESKDFKVVGVYNPQDLLHKISEICKQMSPEIRGITTSCVYEDKVIVSLEVPAVPVFQNPVFYKGAGIINGSFCRIGDSDEPMNVNEIYGYEAFRQHKQDDIRLADIESKKYIDEELVKKYLINLKINKPNTRNLSDNELLELMNIYKNGVPTLSSILCFSKYPQAYYPQLCITAVLVPGVEMGDTNSLGTRFIANKRIEGTISEMVDGALNFVAMNGQHSVAFDKNGKRIDRESYPLTAVREAIINALVHRDYSVNTEGIPVRLEMYKDRLEIINEGGLFGSNNINELGRVHSDTRNANLISILETMQVVENRYSGIPTIIKTMRDAGLPDPLFVSERGLFKVVFYNVFEKDKILLSGVESKIIEFCSTPKSKEEIAEYLGKTSYYSFKNYILPLIIKGKLRYTIPDKPKSKYQKIVKV